jgi:hypothetical protein
MRGRLDSDVVRHPSYPRDLPDRRFGFRTFSPPSHAACEACHARKDLDVHGRGNWQVMVQRTARVEEDIDVGPMRLAGVSSCHEDTSRLSNRRKVQCGDRANWFERLVTQ